MPELDAALRATFADVLHTGTLGTDRAIVGSIRPFDGDRIVGSVSPSARLVPTNDPPLDLYIDEPVLWLVDDAWGMASIDLIKQRWESWVLPGASRDPIACVGRAAALPLACLLARRGLALIEAAAVTRGGHTTLVLAPFGIADELAQLLRAGFGLVGAHRVLLRERSDIVEVIHVGGPAPADSGYRDLAAEFCGSTVSGARCDAVLVVDPARRMLSRTTRIPAVEATGLIHRSLILPDVPELATLTRLPARLARAVPCYRVQLGQDARGLRDLILQIQRIESRPIQLTTFPTGKKPVAA